MQLIDQHTKKIMEECKMRALDAGLKFEDETLEYIVSNRDLLELEPKNMIPTLYDYWVHDVNVLKGRKTYELYPNNPYETVINSRPAISFYNDNNQDWMNVAIFYHVLAHIDFFQNNNMYKNTWHSDFVGQALADKRLLNQLRSEHGRWVDYVIEFSRGIDNLVSYYDELADINFPDAIRTSAKLDFYFDIFLQTIKCEPMHNYLKEIERYNLVQKENNHTRDHAFFSEVQNRYPEFEAIFAKHLKNKKEKPADLMEYIITNSPFLQKEENQWMKQVMHIIRQTSLYYQPMMRTKIFNEGWASYWHEKLFLKDNRIKSHEADFARFHARVTALPRVGLNPYAIGMRLLYYIEELATKGRISYDFQALRGIKERKEYNQNSSGGIDYLFKLREDFCDFTLINTYLDQDFMDKFKLFVTGKRINEERRTWEYYIKSKKAGEYRQMLAKSLYHPPSITVDESKQDELYLLHNFEDKQLVPEYIQNTMLGLEYLWGGKVSLETTELTATKSSNQDEKKIVTRKIRYSIKERKISKHVL